MSNINEGDLAKLSFLTNTNTSNRILRLARMTVSIPAANGPLQPVAIPGFSQSMSGIFNNSDSSASLAGQTLQTPFKTPYKNNNPPSVGAWVDQMTASLPYLPPTTGKPKTYLMVLSTRNYRHKNNDVACPHGSMVTINGNGCINISNSTSFNNSNSSYSSSSL